MFISLTRLHIRRPWYLPAFFALTFRVNRQVVRSAGFVEGRLNPRLPFEYWTVTMWRDQAQMKAFRNGGQHARAMKKLLDWCDEASYAHWEDASGKLPSEEEAFDKLRETGKLSKVRHPSALQQRGDLTGARPPGPGQQLRPKSV